jgi:NAD(P) transhydrogenase alpha subunit
MSRCDYDAVIAGGGLSGLSLAAQLATNGWGDRSVLVIDDPAHAPAAVCWGSWSAGPDLLDAAVSRRYRQIRVHAAGASAVVPTGRYRYRVVRRPDLSRVVSAILSRCPHFAVRSGRVQDIRDGTGAAEVTVDGRPIRADWVFDSVVARPTAGTADARLAFTGWEVHCSRPVFDPETPTLFDFRTPQADTARFVYVLPDDAHRALVEFTEFVPRRGRPAGRATTDAALTGYLRDVLHAGDFELLRTESAVLPLRAMPPSRRGVRVLSIGAQGGLVKASTGYAYQRIQCDSAAITRSLVRHGHPFDIPPPRLRHRLLDAVLLDVLDRDPGQMERTFARLFLDNPAERVLRFLDERSSPADELRLIASMPKAPYVAAVAARALHPARPGPLPATWGPWAGAISAVRPVAPQPIGVTLKPSPLMAARETGWPASRWPGGGAAMSARLTIGVRAEDRPGERRVALVPDGVRKLAGDGFTMLVETDAGASAWFDNGAYADAGAQIVGTAELYDRADVVLSIGTVRPARLRAGQVVIGMLAPLLDPAYAAELAGRGVTAFSLDGIPRQLARAQAMDVLTSQANIAGYKAALVAANAFERYFPLLITAAGTAKPAEVLVLGAGVAGLQAIGTARRLGAVVRAYDVRPASRGEVESLGASFVDLTAVTQGAGEGGYARALGAEEQDGLRAELAPHVIRHDVIIATAQVPGRQPPLLVGEDTVKAMRPGSVVVDLAASPHGGNVAGSEAGRTVVTDNGVTLIGADNLPAGMPSAASAAYSRNVSAFLRHVVRDGAVAVDPDDEIQAGVLVTHGGAVVHPPTARLLSEPTS